jgi:nucleotide-binding universal stress UspA family protein
MSESTSPTHERRLVFGDDGSRGADVAWLWINNHAWPSWRLDVLTGADPLSPTRHWGETPEPRPWAPPWGRTFLGADPPVVEFRRADTDPRLLLDAQSDADLVVVGHRGEGHLRSHWMGSTAEWLLHHPTAPVVIARSASKVQRITCCIDGSVHATRALAALLNCPFVADTEVTVLSVADGRTETTAATAAALALLAAQGLEPAVVEERGHPTNVILDHLEERSPHLVVMGTKGLTGWRRLRVGSTAAAVVHQTSVNALVAWSAAGEESVTHPAATP